MTENDFFYTASDQEQKTKSVKSFTNGYFSFWQTCECLPENFGSLRAVLVVVGVLDYHGSFRELDKTEEACLRKLQFKF